MFELDDLLVNASAEPVPPEEVDDSSHQLLYRAALVLYSSDGDFEVLMALEELQTAMYHVEQINSPFCATLLEAMERSEWIYDIEEMDVEAIVDEKSEALRNGIRVLKGHLQSIPPVQDSRAIRTASQERPPDSTSTHSTHAPSATTDSSADSNSIEPSASAVK